MILVPTRFNALKLISFNRYFRSNYRFKMNITYHPALDDNYMYIIEDVSSKKCAVVDPRDPELIMKQILDRGLDLSMVLTTHHHHDHAHGNAELAKLWAEHTGRNESDLPICGGDNRVQACNKVVKHNEKLNLSNQISIACLHTPCHTSGHICYHVTENSNVNNPGAVFTGDTLFLAGCGRFFEGSAEEMYRALVIILGELPPKTIVFCGHEYTKKNLEFALTVEPNNEAVKSRLSSVIALRENNEATVPGTIEEELATNPFMRVNNPDFLLKFPDCSSAIALMAKLRAMKDVF